MTGLRTTVSADMVMSGAYGQGGETLRALYDKATGAQWNAKTDIDWSFTLDPANPLDTPDETSQFAGIPAWDAMNDRERGEIRRHLQAWKISQILHGEQAALLCASRIVQGSQSVAVKLCAAAQVVDEARHIEVYEKLLNDKIGALFPIAKPLEPLFRNVLSDTREDVIMIGMQILIEGLALATFRRLQAFSMSNPFKTILSYVIRDESRHFAFGRLLLRPMSSQYTTAEIGEREEFICDAVMALDDYLFAGDAWRLLDLPPDRCAEIARRSSVNRNWQRTLFRQLVPAVRDMGLLGPRTTKVFAELGVLDCASFPSWIAPADEKSGLDAAE